MSDLYGWFDSAEQTAPTYEPPRDAPCPYCGEPCTQDDVRTHSLVAADPANRDRCYFYRTHRTCDVAAGADGSMALFRSVMQRIDHDAGHKAFPDV